MLNIFNYIIKDIPVNIQINIYFYYLCLFILLLYIIYIIINVIFTFIYLSKFTTYNNKQLYILLTEYYQAKYYSFITKDLTYYSGQTFTDIINNLIGNTSIITIIDIIFNIIFISFIIYIIYTYKPIY